MIRLLFISALLFSFPYETATARDYAKLFNQSLFKSCANELPGIFENAPDGCHQVNSNLVWGPQSNFEGRWDEADRFCGNLNRIKSASQQGNDPLPPWRLPTKDELHLLHLDLNFVANALGIDWNDEELKNGLGLFPAGVQKHYWIEGSVSQKGTWAHEDLKKDIPIKLVRKYDLLNGFASELVSHRVYFGTFNFTSEERKISLDLNLPHPAFTLCVRDHSTSNNDPKVEHQRSEKPKTKDVQKPHGELRDRLK